MVHGEHTKSHYLGQVQGRINADVLHAEMIEDYIMHGTRANAFVIDSRETSRETRMSGNLTVFVIKQEYTSL